MQILKNLYPNNMLYVSGSTKRMTETYVAKLTEEHYALYREMIYTSYKFIGTLPCRASHEVSRRKITKDSWTKEENRKLWECYLQSKPKKRCYRTRIHGIWKQEKMKEVREQQLCDERIQKHWLEELQMETS